MNTLLLDTTNWDLVVNTQGNLAVATNLYALAQDAASACRTFLGEVWYDTMLGIPFTDQILGKLPPTSFLQAQFQGQSEAVPGIASAKVTLNPVGVDRTLTGKIELTSVASQTAVVTGQIATPWYANAIWPPVPGNTIDIFVLGSSSLGGTQSLG